MPPEADDDMVQISRKELRQLRRDSEWLGWLEDAGVDNWPGIDDARESQREARRAKVGEPLDD
jgi:hypothetical protein